MNKIIVNDDNFKIDNDSSLVVNTKIRQDLFDISKIDINVINDTELVIEYNNDFETKIDVNIKIEENINFKLYEIRRELEVKAQYKYYLKDFSNLLVNKFYNCNKLKELDIVYLNGINSEINYNLNTISTDKQKIDLIVYHNNNNTISNITNKAVNILNGNITFNITGNVDNNICDCIINQNNRIINLNDKKCSINPILLIDENDVEANHSALIGNFNDKELFYLMSRGIKRDDAIKLLIRGFLSLDVKNDEKIDEIINKYWR